MNDNDNDPLADRIIRAAAVLILGALLWWAYHAWNVAADRSKPGVEFPRGGFEKPSQRPPFNPD